MIYNHNIKLRGYSVVSPSLTLGTDGSYGKERIAIEDKDSAWDGFIIKATFTNAAGASVSVVVYGNEVDVPHEATEAAGVGQLAFVGYDAQNTERIRTTAFPYRVSIAGITDGGNPGAITPTLAEQMLAAEARREANERIRTANEDERQSNEAQRITAEEERNAAEAAREAAIAEAIAKAENASASANHWSAEAKAATEAANEAADTANDRADYALQAATRADTAADDANAATNAANAAANRANTEAASAHAEAQAAVNAARSALNSASTAETAASNANAQANRASNMANKADTAATNAQTEADNAKVIADNAMTTANAAQAIADEITRAKEAGEFKGDKGDPGDDYVITDADYNAIAAKTADVVQPTITALNQSLTAEIDRATAAETELAKQQAVTDRVVDALVKLQQGQTADYEVDSTEAYSKTIPSGAVAVGVQSIGGKSIVLNQSVGLTGPNGETEWDEPLTASHKYVYRDNGTASILTNVTSQRVTGGEDEVVDLTRMGLDVTAAEFNRAFPEYIPQNDGEIVSYSTESVEIGGRNLLKSEAISKTSASVVFDVQDDGSIKASGTSTGYAQLEIRSQSNRQFFEAGSYYLCGGYGIADSASAYIWYQFYDAPIDGNSVQGKAVKSGEILIDLPVNCWLYTYARVNNGQNANGIVFTPYITKAKMPYSPYHEPTTLSTAALAQKYFPEGMHSAGEVRDELDLENKLAIKRVGSVDLGTQTWIGWEQGGSTIFRTQIPIKNPSRNSGMICAQLEVNRSIPTWDALLFGQIAGGGDNQNVYIRGVGTPEEFRRTLVGTILYYELADPITTPITEDLRDFMAQPVEAGGSITLHNDKGAAMPVPSAEKYLIKLSEVAT